MKLSEAIRLGAMMRQQSARSGRTHLIDVLDGSCALEAACEAIGHAEAVGGGYQHIIYEAWQWLKGAQLMCPECNTIGADEYTIWHLNDTHCWSRERIADWVESIENTLETSKEAPCASSVSMPISEVSTGA
jgi:hypothetical protein